MRASQWFSLTAALTIVLLGSAPKLAAQTTQMPPPSEVELLAGPVTLYPSIVLRDVGFDSNLGNDPDEPKEDFTLTAQPRLRAAVPFGSTLFTASATVGLVYFATYKDQQSINRLFEGRLEGATWRLRPFLAAAHNHTNERAGYEIDARVLRQEATVSGGGELKFSGITSLTGFYRHSTHDFGDDERFLGTVLANQLDHTADVASVGARYAVTPLTTITLDVEAQRDRFDTSAIRNADSVRVVSGAQFSPDAMLKGGFAVGYREFNPQAPVLPKYRGLVGSVGLAYTLHDATVFRVEATRDVEYSFEPTTPYYLLTTGRLTLSQRIVGPCEVIALGGQDKLQYQGVEGSAMSGRVDRTLTVGGGVGFRLSPTMRLAVIYDYAERVSNQLDRRAYLRRRVFASAIYGQ